MQLRRERYSTRDGPATANCAAAHEDDVACGLARRSSLTAAADAADAAADVLLEYVEKACSFKRVLTTGLLALSIVLLPPSLSQLSAGPPPTLAPS